MPSLFTKNANLQFYRPRPILNQQLRMDSSNSMVTNLTFEGWEPSVPKEIKERLTKPKTLGTFFKINSEVRLGLSEESVMNTT